jgi:hypothetical protein
LRFLLVERIQPLLLLLRCLCLHISLEFGFIDRAFRPQAVSWSPGDQDFGAEDMPVNDKFFAGRDLC